MPVTFIKIATATVGSGGAASIDFTSIPATYTDLCIKYSLRSTTSQDWCRLTFNGSSSNLTSRFIRGNGSSVDSETATNNDFSVYMNGSGTTSNTFASTDFYFPNYANSLAKTLLIDTVQEANTTLAYALIVGQLWNDTAAVNQITVTAKTGLLAQYSTATLYGISKS
jgi:hypothetical protein